MGTYAFKVRGTGIRIKTLFVEIASLSIRKFGNKNIATGDFEISFYALDPEKMKSK